ncbi:MAG: peptidoglycan editing factor PgeF [Pseudomonadales bacterium]
MNNWFAPDWPAPELAEKVGALVTTRGGLFADEGYGAFNLGDHVGDDTATVAAHREALSSPLGVSQIQWLAQVHGTAVCQATVDSARQSVFQAPPADASFTLERGLALAIMTADCVPIVLADSAGGWVAALHGGWRGLVDGIVAQLVQQLQATVPSAPDTWCAWIGPAICGAHYEVGAEVAAAVRAGAPQQAPEMLGLRQGRSPDKYQLDLVQLARWQLARQGIEAVTASRLCSFGDARFYSHRRSVAAGAGATGRMATLVWLR